MNMGVVMAQSYTDQLSDNVRRSIALKFVMANGVACIHLAISMLLMVKRQSNGNT